MSFWSQTREIARRDLLAERRAGEVLTIVIPFGTVALMAFPLALGIESAVLSRVGPAVFWVVTFLFAMQIALRHTASDRPTHRRTLTLMGVDPFARIVGRSLAASILIGLFMAVMFPIMVLFYSPQLPPGWPAAAIPAALAGVGLAQVATLAAEVTAGLRARTTLTSLIVAPLAIPFLVGGSQALESLAIGGSILSWTLLVAASDLALAVTAALIARPLEESL
jgi:heme exporter protein B